ncbi:MAG: DUF882 domain-containing protein [Proteobacteria bacterium]|nr:DUF882 domain-containing protein [Pseudomonadota bacterium]
MAAAGTADATPKTASKSAPKVTATATAKTAKADKATKPAATSSKKKRRRTAVFSGANASKSQIRTEPLERPSGEIWLKAENLGEEFKGNIYKKDGTFDDASLAKIDDMFRCVKTGEVRAVRAELLEHMSRIYDHFGGKQVIVVSGFRFAERDSSRHFHASAMDIRVKDVSYQQVYDFAATLDTGHMGLGRYPTSQFVHVDYRAPGEPSFRWTDYSGHSSGKKAKKKSPGRTQPARKPVS